MAGALLAVLCLLTANTVEAFSRATALGKTRLDKLLARISHGISTAAADPSMSVQVARYTLNVKTYSVETARAVRFSFNVQPETGICHARLRFLATKPGEKCGLGTLRRILHEFDKFPCRRAQRLLASDDDAERPVKALVREMNLDQRAALNFLLHAQ